MSEDLSRRLGALGITEKIKPFSDCNLEGNPIDIFKSYIADQLSQISGSDPNTILDALETPLKPENGDLIIPIPKLKLKGNPNNFATQWSEKVFPTSSLISSTNASGVFLKFFFSDSYLKNIVLKDIYTREALYGQNESGKGKKVIVEFSSPNIAKEFHAGHLRNTMLGAVIANLHESCGWKVYRMNYLGDWGKQFGLLAIGFERFGSEEELANNPFEHLYNVYVRINSEAEAEEVKINAAKLLVKENGEEYTRPENNLHDLARAYFHKMENGDESALSLWKRFRDYSIQRFKTNYARLNVHFDEYSGESQVSNESIDKAMKILDSKGLLVRDDGAVLIDFNDKKLGKAIITKKDGTTLYLTRDIGAALQRYEDHKFDKMVYVVASQQDLHLAQLFKILEKMEYPWADRCLHVNYGLVKGMSTRKGTAVFLDDILKDTADKMHEVMRTNETKYHQVQNPESTAHIVGMAAIIVSDMSGKRNNSYTFSWDRMFNFEGDTGPYLQYAHARLCSMERNSEFRLEHLSAADFSSLNERQAINLLRILSQYPDVVLSAFKTQEPSTIVTYLFKMTHCMSSCYDVLWVANQPHHIALPRMALYRAARVVLGNALRLLGITPVERM
ncbi:Arginine--tRNA ligase, cytoplasmic [Neolecta irregularis DAH-3]|uniref:arginine--tRNA ligase n=1 Tax=Neolecta irregularis (strain DAH-3) TaxID=1198029 RepID=A0A1U7LUG5_NEOID|nr:Arginine--tRNA ligase, cytoplasmic [Neolecta irregularis DAH-3]|eukprot:OLL26307.1 Arginine--tRNA ligase, cytoplasmic [Neolecta irregularis DAH-3]